MRSTTATLNGSYRAGNLPSTFYFEYGTTVEYGARVPSSDGGMSAGTLRRPSVRLTGLAPMTTYHYRLVASTSQGTVVGPDQAFRTAPVGVAAPAGRAYEMVTPAHKPTRHGAGSRNGVDEDDGNLAVAGMPSPDGDSMLFSLPWVVLGDPAMPGADDLNRLERTSGGWQAQPVFNHPFAGSPEAMILGLEGGASRDQRSFGIYTTSAATIFPEDPLNLGNAFHAYLRLMGRDPSWATPPGWTPRPGWAPAFTSPDQVTAAGGPAAALFTDSGRFVVRSAPNRGLLGPGDPSLGQAAGNDGGHTIYRLDLGDGTRELVNECTGTGSAASLLPARAGSGAPEDTIDTRPCAAGELISAKGAVLGAGNFEFNSVSPPSELSGTATSAVSNTSGHDADRVFFLSPDPLGGQTPAACAATVGASTDCPPQLFVRRWDSHGSAKVAWISRSRSHPAGGNAYDGAMIAGQEIGLMGRGVSYEGASADGSRVFFRTNAPLTPDDPNGTGAAPPAGGVTAGSASNSSWDLYMYELPADPDADPGAGTLTRITGGPDGTADPNTNCSMEFGFCFQSFGTSLRFLAADGRSGYLVTAGTIPGAANSPPAGSAAGNAPAGEPVNASTRNLYRYDADATGAQRWKFVARLPFAVSGLDSCAAAHAKKEQALVSSRENALNVYDRNCVRGSDDGRTIAFTTSAQLTADDADTAFDVYAYDATSDRLTRVSAPEAGASGGSYTCATVGNVQCNADMGWDAAVFGPELAAGPAGQGFMNVSSDGSVFFESRAQLVPEDVNGSRMDTYQWKDGELSLISPGNSDDDAYFSGNSASGRDVFFATSQPIDPREIDPGDVDIYDARVGGGFPPPAPPPPPCQALADQCKGSGTSSPPSSIETGQPGAKAPTGRVRVRRLSAAQLAALAAGRRVFLAVEASRPGRVQVRGSARLAKKRRANVLNASKRIPRPGTARVALRLSGSGREGLARRGRLRVLVSVELLGVPERASLKFTLKAPPRQRAAGAGRRASS